MVPRGFVSRGREDVHVHTKACDDADQTPYQALQDAHRNGLTLVCFTAHVRTATAPDHVYDYLHAAREAAGAFPDIQVRYSIETKIMDVTGALDLPPGLDLDVLDTVHVADHRFPIDGAFAPETIKDRLQTGRLTVDEVWSYLLDASVNALRQYPGAILAHPLSIIPKVGLDPQTVPLNFCQALAQTMAQTDSVMEINEKWRCPALPLIEAAVAAQVPVVSASDAHHAGEAGHFTYLEDVHAELDQA